MALSGKEGDVPLHLSNFSVLDSEFGNMRDRFDREMKKMEEEMDRFKTQLLEKESKLFAKSSQMSSNKGIGNDGDSMLMTTGGGLGSHSNWLQGLDSPLLQESRGATAKIQKELKLRFDVSQYLPEEIVVKTVDNKLLVHAKHEEVKSGNSVFREYNREFLLPHGTDPETIRSSLSKDGILTVEAPLPQPAITNEQ